MWYALTSAVASNFVCSVDSSASNSDDICGACVRRRNVSHWIAVCQHDDEVEPSGSTVNCILHYQLGSANATDRSCNSCYKSAQNEAVNRPVSCIIEALGLRIASEYSLGRSYQINENVMVTMRLILPLDVCNAALYVLSMLIGVGCRQFRAPLGPYRFQAIIEFGCAVCATRYGSMNLLMHSSSFNSVRVNFRSNGCKCLCRWRYLCNSASGPNVRQPSWRSSRKQRCSSRCSKSRSVPCQRVCRTGKRIEYSEFVRKVKPSK